MARTYSLNDLGVTADDLILLDASGYSFDETDNISEEKRDEILSRLYDLKHKDRENAQKETPSVERKTPEIQAATDEQLKDMNYRLKHGEHLSAQEVASAVARGGIVSKDMRAEIKNAIVSFTNADNVSEEEAGAVSYLLDELDGKHIEKHKNGHSVEEYKKQFADSPEILEAAGKKLEEINNAPAAVVMYDKEDIDALLRQGEIYLRKPEEVDNLDIIKQANPNYREEIHQELFAEHVEQVSSLIKDYAEGRADISPEALESMEKLVEAYGKEYQRGTVLKNDMHYDITQDAANAHQRLAAERVALKKDDKELSERLETRQKATAKFTNEYDGLIEDLVKDVAYAGTDADREKAVAEFNKKMSKAMEEAGMTSEADKERNRAYLEASLKDDQNLFGYLGNEYNDAAKYLLDENGKLKDGVAVYTASEKEAPVEEKVEDKELSKEEVEAAIKKNKYIVEAAPLVDELIEKIANAKNDAERQGAINVFKFETARQYVANQQDEGLLDFVRKDLEEKLNNNGGNKERKAAAKYLLDENGKLKDGVVFSTAPEKETPVEEKVETKTEDKVEDKGPSKEEVDAAKKKKPKDRTLHDWIVLKEDIEHNPKLSEGQKKYELKSLTDQARTHKMNKSPKELSSDELKDADAFMAAFGYDIDRKGRKATNPVAMRWKEGVDKRKKAEAANDEIVVEQPVEQKTEQEPEEKKNDGKEDDKGKGGVAPVVIPGRHITNDKGVTEWEEHKPAQEKNKEKKKKGLFGRIGDWAKRNWKKIAIGGAILAASLFGAKSCNSNQGGDDKGKDKIEVVTPTPHQEEHQIPEIVVTGKQTFDLDMAHQYCKRMGYQLDKSEDDAIARYVMDRMTYATVKDKVAGHLGIDSLNIDQQMAILATVRGNTPKNADVINGILNGKAPGEGYNVATLAKLRKEAEKFTVRAEDGTIQYRNPEEFTKQTGTQSIEVSKDKITQKAAALNWTPESHTR